MNESTERVEIFLPPTDAKLNAHNKGHWRSKLQAVNKRRAYARLMTRSAMNKFNILEKWKRASLSYRFFVPNNIQRDRVNMMQQEKASVDGVVDAGLIVGDHWQVLEIVSCEVIIRKLNPGTVLIFKRLE